ncbi:hypothetical protein FALBO_4426 [Fusarium albosuccineum]|uniref:Uncharacterized protein n=1 Tax=Fusarium albosuccineum TaxID=1237068 RepID=A0A8H4LFH5_9HYPO|nr:hypothetical protein FALBO_4426 [Fusarium albosuccineum]
MLSIGRPQTCSMFSVAQQPSVWQKPPSYPQPAAGLAREECGGGRNGRDMSDRLTRQPSSAGGQWHHTTLNQDKTGQRGNAEEIFAQIRRARSWPSGSLHPNPNLASQSGQGVAAAAGADNAGACWGWFARRPPLPLYLPLPLPLPLPLSFASQLCLPPKRKPASSRCNAIVRQPSQGRLDTERV